MKHNKRSGGSLFFCGSLFALLSSFAARSSVAALSSFATSLLSRLALLPHLEQLEGSQPDPAGVVQVLKEPDTSTLKVGDVGRVERVRLHADTADELVVRHLEVANAGHRVRALAVDNLAVKVNGPGFALQVVDSSQGADGLLNRAELKSTDGGGGQQRREHKVVRGGNHLQEC